MSVRVKKTAAALLASSGVLRLGAVAATFRRDRLLLLAYHRVMPIDSAHRGDLELVSATPEEFEWQIAYLRRHFEPVTFAQIANALDGDGKLPKRAVAVTFDDGFADVYEHAFPVLQRLDTPATVFVSTGNIDERQPFWFDLVAWIIMRAPPDSIRLAVHMQTLPSGAGETERRSAAVKALKWLKNCDEAERARAVTSLCEQFPDVVASGRQQLGRALTWDEIREMARGGIEFGSHTVSHCCLTKVTAERLDHELVHSKGRLEAELSMPIAALAYPFGGTAAFNDDVIAAAQRTGYRIATSYMPGINELDSVNRFALLRQNVERDTSRAYFQALVHVPELFD
jgi:peptidoglycan/xylan/chitin deacetylase (PgdA/CDA1 family)